LCPRVTQKHKLGIIPEKISVVGEGVRSPFLRAMDKKMMAEQVKSYFGVQNPYLIFVGTLEKRKNVLGLIEIFENIKTNHDLVLVGGRGFEYQEIEKALEFSTKKSKIKKLGFVDDQYLPALYRAADAMVFPSFEEGYGIPIIEAMACGIPVVSSNTTSMPEVGHGYTYLFSPRDIRQGVEVLEGVLTKSDLVASRTKRAQSYARSLTWDRVAQSTRDVYVDVLKRFKSPRKLRM
jgi:glycosyltransferase involved in cell wall biosynthesis